ncbi:MAG: hypothetical protein IJY28_09415 [Clostridia bacterium]|nr:hypothetical protein [Clostridia bacterium]
MDFKKIPNSYRPVPFWSWNEKLDTAETREQIEKMEQAGIGGFFMHARGGLQTEYMGDEWFSNVEASIEEAEQRGMHAWAYDENGWPSGFGSGKVNGRGVAYQQKFLRYDMAEDGGNTIARVGGMRLYYEVNPYYVDVLDGNVTQCFLDEIYAPYYEKYKNRFEGFFTDEPQISRNGIPWSFILPEEYRKAYGDDLIPHLPELFKETGDYALTRIRFWRLIAELFSKNFFKKIYDWCDERGLKLTGHLVMEESLDSQIFTNGACMPQYEYFHIPGMDWLGRHNNRSLTPYQVGSVARQLGKKQVLSETFACCGHNVGHDELKWIYEYQMVRGINLLCQHLEGYSNRGLRKRDYPPAMYIQQPWWDEYKKFNDAMSRIGMLLAEGDDGVDTLVIHPQTTAWILYNGNDCPPPGKKYNEQMRKIFRYKEKLFALMEQLEQKHINFHFGDEILMERHGRVDGAALTIGEKTYTRIILPEHERLMPYTEELLAQYRANGGIILTAAEAADLPNHPVIDAPQITYCFRRLDDADLYYFVNSTEETVTAHIPAGGKVLDPVTGELSDFDGTHEFKKYESLLVIDDGTPQARLEATAECQPIPLDGAWQVVNATENCITLDYCDYYFDGKLEEEHGYILNAMYRAMEKKRPVHITCRFRVQARYVPEKMHLAMEMSEQFDIFINDHPVTKTDCGYFRDKSFRKLDISGLLTEGENVITLELDFAQSPVVYENMAKGMCHESEKNKLTFDMELEQIYLVGDFAVETPGAFEELARGACRYAGEFVIAPPKRAITLRHIEQQGFPFFAGALTVEKRFTAHDAPMMLDFVKTGINTVTARVNGKPVSTFLWEPFRADVTHLLQPGENTLTLTLKNNLRNMQGPLHLEIGESFGVGPGNFYKEPCIWNRSPAEGRWNDDYCFVHLSLTNRNA